MSALIFEPITLEWEGKAFTIPPNAVMPALAAIEEVITMGRLAVYVSTGEVPLVKVSQALAVALRHAGARVSAEEVYAAMFTTGEIRKRALQAVQTLQMMMIPPEHLRKATPGKAATTGRRAASSRKSTSS